VESKDKSSRERLLAAAASLLASEGTSVSTRAICEAAGVTAPTLYHHFGDRDGLLNAVVSHGFREYLDSKRTIEHTGDPLEDLRLGWDNHVAWGLAHPNFYALMFGQVKPGVHAAAADEASALLLERLTAAARAGLLTVPPEIAVRMVMSANTGLTLQLISQPDAAAADLSARVRDSTFAGILGGAGSTSDAAGAAIALKAALPPESVIAAAERPLLEAWLDRIALAKP
jgi:AcrR family transcriptional regulator